MIHRLRVHAPIENGGSQGGGSFLIYRSVIHVSIIIISALNSLEIRRDAFDSLHGDFWPVSATTRQMTTIHWIIGFDIQQ